MKKLLVLMLCFFLLSPAPAPGALHTKDEMPEFLGISLWAGKPVSRKTLSGKVVIVNFFNSIDPAALQGTKTLVKWHQKYYEDGVVIVGIVSPEYDFEKDFDQFRKNIGGMKLPYPVALDSDSVLWKAYNNQVRPALYFADARGRIRYAAALPENFDQQEKRLQDLIKEQEPGLDEKLDIDPAPRLLAQEIISLGYRKLERLGNQGTVFSELAQNFLLPDRLKPGLFYLSGKWKLTEDHLQVVKAGAFLKIPWDGRPAFLVAGCKRDTPSPVEVLIDGAPVTDKKLKGKDLFKQAGRSYLFIQDFKLYSVCKKLPPGNHVLQMLFSNPDIQLFRMIFTSDNLND